MSIKNFVKKNIVAVSIGAVLLGAGGIAVVTHLLDERDDTMLSTAGVAVSESEVKAIIAEHTGISDLNYESLNLERDSDYPNPHYDVDTNKDGIEYDFEIDAVTGEILNYTTDTDNEINQQTTTSSSKATLATSVLSEDEVKKIVADTTGKTDLKFVSVSLSTDDGIEKYDVKATSGNESFDLDIDAVSGHVLSSEKEIIANAQTTATAEVKISEDKAKGIVAKTTGAKNLTYTQLRLEQDRDDYNGAHYYEITAHAEGVEYELDIDANTGQVLSSSAETNDD